MVEDVEKKGIVVVLEGAVRRADWQTGRLADWQTGRLADWQAGRWIDWASVDCDAG